MSASADALAHLQSVAPDFGATLTSVDGSHQAALTVSIPGGHKHAFELELTFSVTSVSVRERPVGSMLPTFCPDRHINPGGTFCLGWGTDDPSDIVDVDAAIVWWSALVRYLTAQVSANKRGVWPGRENDRAHGNAAEYQAEAEDAAMRLGAAFASNAKEGRLEVRADLRSGHARLELWQAGKRLARLSLRTKELVGEHTLCPCNAVTRNQITKCGDHAKDLATFIHAQYRWRKAEREFMQQLAKKGIQCCGTLSSCGLRDAAAVYRNSPKPNEKPHARRSKFYRAPTKSRRPR